MLNVSIVLYQPDWAQIADLTRSLLQCAEVRCVYWIDNSPTVTETLPLQSDRLRYIFNNRNLGYGAAHNIAIRESIYDDIPYHLVINPDIIIQSDTLPTLLQFMQDHPAVGMVSPKVVYPNGELQYNSVECVWQAISAQTMDAPSQRTL